MMTSNPNTKSRMGFFFVNAVAVALLLAGAGCGGDSSSGTGTSGRADSESPRMDLCSLLTASDIEEALGTSAGEPEPGDDGLGQCTWRSADGAEVAVLTLDRAVLDSFDHFVADYGEEFGGENPPRDRFHSVDVAGADWAMYLADDDMVEAYRGDEVLEVSSPSAEEARLVDVAARAMARLP